MKGETRGFTIIEVILFLGISSLLFVVAFSYTNGTIRETGFVDASNQLTNFLQRQYLTVKNSQSTRASTDASAKCNATDTAAAVPGASNSCMVLGKLLYFNAANSSIDVSTIVGDAVYTEGGSEQETIRLSRPRVIDTSSSVKIDESFSLPSRLTFTQMLYKNDVTPSAFTALALLRSPISENIYLVSWDTTAVGPGSAVATYNGASGIASRLAISGSNYPYVDKPLLICAKEDTGSSRRAAVVIPTGDTVDKVTKVVTRLNDPLSIGMSCTL